MRTWFLFPFLISFAQSGTMTFDRDRCRDNPDITYASPSGAVIGHKTGLPIYTADNSYLFINGQKYFWNEDFYQVNASRPVICKGLFDSTIGRFENIFIIDEDDNSEAPLYEKLNRHLRPNMTIYDCEADNHCCYGRCCTSSERIVRYIVLSIVFIIIALIGYAQSYEEFRDCRQWIQRRQRRQTNSSSNVFQTERTTSIVADRLSQISPSTSQPLSSPSTSISVLSEDLHNPTDEEPPPSYLEVTSSKR